MLLANRQGTYLDTDVPVEHPAQRTPALVTALKLATRAAGALGDEAEHLNRSDFLLATYVFEQLLATIEEGTFDHAAAKRFYSSLG